MAGSYEDYRYKTFDKQESIHFEQSKFGLSDQFRLKRYLAEEYCQSADGVSGGSNLVVIHPHFA